jgi:NADPH-dependent 2,4-dienoyl-CoA reductase/sulfur reductase-like enzyme
MSDSTDLGCDVLVIGAGPSGIAASVCAAERGAHVLMVDDNALPGGQIWRACAGETPAQRSAGKTANRWLDRLAASGVAFLSSTRVVAQLTAHSVLAESETNAIDISFQNMILANGARELLLPFPGWTLPNVFAAGGLQALVKSGFSVDGKRIVVAGTGPLLLAVAAYLRSKGARIAGIYEQSSFSNMVSFGASLLARPAILKEALAYRAALAGVPLRWGWWPVSAQGDRVVQSLTVTDGSRRETLECDLVACGFHLVPNTELQSACGCAIADGKTKVDKWQRTSVQNIFSVGETTGIGGLELALLEGQIAGLAATGFSDADPAAKTLLVRKKKLEGVARAMDRAFALRTELRTLVEPDTIVCRCEDIPWSEIRHQRSARSAKLHTRCGMGACQGRICGAALYYLSGWSSESTRPPIFPVRVSTLIRTPESLSKEKP